MEKESKIGTHQTTNNSGVIHAGIYYKPNSKRAKLCVEGLHLLYDYCDKKNIPYDKCGKLIIATNESEIEGLHKLYERATINKVPDIRLIEGDQIKEIEPHFHGVKALHSPHTGIIDFINVANSFAEDFKSNGGEILLDFEVEKIWDNQQDGICLRSTKNGENKRKYNFVNKLITCCGLYSDRVAKKYKGKTEPKVIPVRGKWINLKDEYSHLLKGNVYPVPNPNLPFLGVHFSRKLNGEIWLGPNAVLATSRMGYSYSDFNFKDFVDAISYRGTLKLIKQWWKFGLKQVYNDFNIESFVEELKPYLPEITKEHLVEGKAGVRAMALTKEGNMIDDFVFETSNKSPSNYLHVRNAPSPAATASIAIGKEIVNKATDVFNLTNNKSEFRDQ
eukprot:TRINITY_DN3006_c0_g1_i1.p1 TRINITY_DN3006_c0_g1~~TRINITY_DN3006_c0_g1_i1.p1  ORF type:complete len:390 (+),score=105.51 TRINITY_DN3006_c0_g1_i1:226-1395(+)